MNSVQPSESSCPACGTSTQFAGEDALCPGCLLGAALKRGYMGDEIQAPALDECGGYLLEKIIGRGGHGVVYLARRPGSIIPYALKMLASAQLAGPDELRRFRFEAEAVFQLNHRHIIRVVDIGEHEGFPYFVMDFAEGGNLAESSDQAFDPTAARHFAGDRVTLMVKVARAVHFAHERGVLHRDLKPANILLDRHGEPLVSDFGLARQLHASSGVTMTGAALGTPSYMSPEQAAGGSVTTATDQFSLGVILYQMLTGRTPFEGGGAIEILRKAAHEDAPDPRTFAPWLDRDLTTICLTALRREPARRYATVAMFADDLERWQRGEPVRARPLSAFERLVKWSRRHPVSATFGLTGGLACIVLLTLLVTGRQLLEKEKNNALRQEAVAQQSAREAMASERAATTARDAFQLNSYAADIYLAYRANADGHLGQARNMLARHLPAAGGADLRGFEWHALQRLCRGDDIRTFQDHSAAVMAVAFDPTGKTIASAGRDGRVVVRAVESGGLVNVLPKPDALYGQAANPLMAGVIARSGEMNALVAATRPAPEVLEQLGGPSKLGEIACIAWSSDGKSLLTASNGSYVRLWSMPDGELRGLIPVTTAKDLAFSADGGSLFVFRSMPEDARQHELRIYQAETLSLRRVIGGLLEPHAVSADGNLAAVMPETGNRIVLHDTRKNEPLYSLDHGFPVKQLAFSTDGKTLFGAELSGILVACWRTSDGQRTGSVFPVAGKYERFLPSPDGLRLAATGARQDLTFQALGGESPAAILRGHEDLIHALAYSPDGKRLASAGNDHSCRIWQATPAPAQGVGQAEFDAEPAIPPETVPAPPGGQLIRAASRHGQWVGDGMKHGMLRFYPLEESGHVRDLTSPDAPYSRLVAAPDGKGLAAFLPPCDLQLLDPDRGDWSTAWKLSEGTVGPIIFSPDGKWIASGGDDNVVTIRSRPSGETLAVLRGHQGRILDLAVSPDGRTLASCADDSTLRLWHVATWRELGTLHQGETMAHLKFSKSGDVLRGVTAGGQVRDFGGNGR